MARGKIIYTPLESRAISLAGANWLSQAQAVFNFGLNAFNFDLLVYLDPAAQPDSEAWLLGKGAPFQPPTWSAYPAWLGTELGLIMSYLPRYGCLKVVLNDDQLTPAVYLSPENVIPEAGWYWLGFGWDRAGDPYFMVNGVIKTAVFGAGAFPAGDIPAGGSPLASAYPGSLDNDEPLRLGGYDGYAWRFAGKFSFVRLDYERVLPADWYREEWDRLRYGFPRNNDQFRADCLAAWTFPGDLADDQAGYELAYNGGGSPVYVAGWPYGPLEVAFEHNFDWDYLPGYLDLNDRTRTLDGTYQAYAQEVQKQTIKLPLKFISHAQKTSLMAAHLAAGEVQLWLDADHRRACRGTIPAPPECQGLPNFQAGEQIWDAGEVEVQSL